MSREHAARMIDWQATACAMQGSPLYAALLPQVAADLRAGGVCAEALAGYEDAPGADAIALRLLGGVHARVLTGRAPGLAEHFPSMGGEFRPERATDLGRAFLAAVGEGMAWVRDWMTRPPQTNEVGRAGPLLAGALHAATRRPLPVRLFELGASAGLNLRADRFRCTAPEFAWGPEDSPVRLEGAWQAPVPQWLTRAARRRPELTVVERRGCDISPVDPLSPDGALALRAYVWPDQAERAARLDGALRLAAKVPAEVEQAGVAEFLAGIEPQEGTLTVVWHSIMRQYVPSAEWARAEGELERLARADGGDDTGAGFAYVAFEPAGAGAGVRPCHLSVRVGTGAREILAEAPPHGLPGRG
ncbi:DUF2332 domain-containing protein [Streptomyces sp. N2-109]|uniref:DUF2332 domain-containing protein n=1 Tax=Streptomyces gossypii TaxID=2883101 RepID=A0ABT2JU78_9ACTN|nr:DUF2332 domain-containing protein [Streptomyces gossypii]MCT2591452.1 DUF2332 domain-containing protein [Streptomyces gossypii]